MAKKKPVKAIEEEALAEETAAITADPVLELGACKPFPVRTNKFNQNAVIPYGCTLQNIEAAMKEFVDFLGFINTQLNGKELRRFESMLMPANFSSLVGEFMGTTIPKHCNTLAKNVYHNGHPDLIPKGIYPGESLQHGTEGIEIKGSRYARGWQGHNAEECWLMVFVFLSNRPVDATKGVPPRPFRFQAVYFGRLLKEDWNFSGRKEGSRRTITASVTQTGYEKMRQNWIYYDDSLPERGLDEVLEESE